MATETLFTKIINKELPSDMVYQDDLVTAFRDINPVAPTHILIVPNEPVPSSAQVEPEHEAALGRMQTVARQLAEQEGISETGFRLIINCGEHGHQEVPHLHMHLIGGGDLGRMLSKKVTA